MADDLLDGGDVVAGAKHSSRCRVARRVHREAVVEPLAVREAEGFGDAAKCLRVVIAGAGTLWVRKDILTRPSHEPLQQDRTHAAVYRNIVALAILRLAKVYLAAIEIHLRPCELNRLAAAHSGIEVDLEDIGDLTPGMRGGRLLSGLSRRAQGFEEPRVFLLRDRPLTLALRDLLPWDPGRAIVGQGAEEVRGVVKRRGDVAELLVESLSADGHDCTLAALLLFTVLGTALADEIAEVYRGELRDCEPGGEA